MRPDLTFDSKTVVVTGGSSGIGAAVVGLFSEHGARVYSLDLEEPLPAAAHLVRFLRVDVTKPQEVEDAVRVIAAATGRLDALITCAGITRDHVVWKMTDEDWNQVLAVNLNGTFHGVRAAAPWMRKQGSGSMVLIASINGERGKCGLANYAASKAGVIALAKTAARELGGLGVRVNAISPGFIETPMTRGLPGETIEAAVKESALGRPGRPEDVANAALFLCSDLALHITGQVLRVDGGQYT